MARTYTTVLLSRAMCPRCDLIVTAQSATMREALCRAHDAEVHGFGPGSSLVGAPPAASAAMAANTPTVLPSPKL